MPKKGSITVSKVQYACTGKDNNGNVCGKLSKWRYPKSFTQQRENYMCRKCAKNVPEYKKQVSNSVKKYFEDPTARMRNKEAQKISKNRPDAKKRQSESGKKYFITHPEARDQISIVQKKRFEDPEERKKASIAQKKRFENPEERKRHSEILKTVDSNPEVKKRMSDAQIASQNRPDVKQKCSKSQKKRFENPEERNKISIRQAKRFEDPEERKILSNKTKMAYFKKIENELWYGHPLARSENLKKEYCELWKKSLWVRIDAAWDYKSAISQKTRWDSSKQKQLDRHHVYWQEKACCVWDKDTQGYYANINNGTKLKPEIVKYYIKGNPNKFVLLTHNEHMMVRGSKKTGKDKIYWINYFEDLIEKRETEGKSCYLSKEEYEIYNVEQASTIAYYTQKRPLPLFSK